MDHKPERFTVVSQDDYSVTVFAMCVCGDGDCYFSGSVGMRDIAHLFVERETK